jgi:hypothetical protein
LKTSFWRRALLPGCLLALTHLSACSTVGLNLPFDGAPVAPDGLRLKPTMGWLTTQKIVEPGTMPEGSVALKQVRINRRIVWQQVRRLTTDQGEFADSILLDRETLRPIETWRWTPKGTYITRYNHRAVEREFRSPSGEISRSSEILEVEPYSALGVELVVSTLSLGDGETGLVPVAIDTAQRGWAWVRYTVRGEINAVERPNSRPVAVWLIDLDMLGERTRIWVASDGRAVRRIEHINEDNEVLSLVRRMLLGGQ